MNVGVVFSIILSIIVIIMVLALGSKQIIDLLGLSNTALTKKAIQDLSTTANRVYSLGEGSTLKFDLTIPGNTRFCFIDPENPEANIDPDPDRRWRPDNVIISIIQEKQYNIWVYGDGFQEGYRIEHLQPAENFCAKSGTKLFFTNNGLTVGLTD